MISQATIQKIVDDIVKGVNPIKVILFGSYARGSQTTDSDLDIFVVAEMEGSSVERIRRVRGAITSERLAVDVVVRTPYQVQKSLTGRDWFVQEVFEQGKVLYERRN